MLSITHQDLTSFTLWQGDREVKILGTNNYFSIGKDSIHILSSGPMYGNYALKIKKLEILLSVKSCNQCGRSDFDIRIEQTGEKVNLIEIFLQEYNINR